MQLKFAAGLCAVAIAVALSGILPHTALAQAKQDATPAAAMDEKAMMDMMMQMGAPGEHHKIFDTFVGTWDTAIQSWMAPGTPPMESKGTSVNTLVLGGRFVQQDFKGEFGGMPFTGLGFTGYDNTKKKYTGLWMDNMGTAVMVMEGNLDATGKIMTCTADMLDPMSGAAAKTREVTTIIDKDHHRFEMYVNGPDGQDMKMMEINYTRKM